MPQIERNSRNLRHKKLRGSISILRHGKDEQSKFQALKGSSLGPTLEKMMGLSKRNLIRVFGSPAWISKFPFSKVSMVHLHSSDHCLLLLDSSPNTLRPKKRFYFDKRWVKREGCEAVVMNARNNPHSGNPMYKIQAKIRSCRVALLKWASGNKTNSARAIDNIRKELDQLHSLGGHRDWQRWSHLKLYLNHHYRMEEHYWQQKSRITWLKDGNKNTKFFHAYATQRMKRNCIVKLVRENGTLCESQHDIQNEISSFYDQLFTSSCPAEFTSLFDGMPVSVSRVMNQKLTLPVDEAEIKRALFSLHPHKAPGPDRCPVGGISVARLLGFLLFLYGVLSSAGFLLLQSFPGTFALVQLIWCMLCMVAAVSTTGDRRFV